MSLLLVLLRPLLGNDEVIFVKEEHLPQGKVRKNDPVDWKASGTATGPGAQFRLISDILKV